jgi:PAS domain S-box-containing protein
MNKSSGFELNEMLHEVFPALLEISSEPFWIRDIQSGTGYWLASTALISKYRLPDDITPGDQWKSGIHEDDRERIVNGFTKALVDKSIHVVEQEYRFKGDRQFYHISEKVKIERDEAGNARRCFCTWRDVTDLRSRERQVEEALQHQKNSNDQLQAELRKQERTLDLVNKELHRDHESLLRTAFILNKSQQITKTGSWQIDLKTGEFSCSNEFYAIHGIDRSFNLADQELFLALYDSNAATKIQAGLERLKHDASPMDLTFQFKNSIGSKRWFRVIAYPFFHKDEMAEITGVLHDITIFKEKEEQLRASEEKFFTLFKFTPDLMALARESDGVIVEVNDKAMSMCGYTENEMIGKTARDLGLWVDMKEFDQFFIDYAATGKALAEVTWHKKGGQMLFVLISAVRVKIRSEYFRLSLVKDITTRKKAEQKFNAAFNLNPDMMAILREADETIEDINENVMTILGISREDVIGKKTTDLNLWVHPEERDKYFEQFRTNDHVSYEAKWRKKSGQEIYVLISAVRISLYDEKFILTSIKDITARMEAEKIFQTVFRSSPDMMAIIRQKDSMIIDVNDRVYHSIGFTREELIGRQIDNLNIWFQAEDRVDADLSVANPPVYETKLRNKNGNEVFALVSSALVEIFGEPHVLYITKDITDHKKAEDKVRYSEANLAATINNTNTVIWSMDVNYTLIAQNESSRQYTKEHFGKYIEVGEPLRVFDNSVDLETRTYWDEKYQRVFKGEHVHCFHHEFDRDFEISINPIHHNGQVVGLTVFSIDITDRINREREVVQNLEQLAEAERRIGELKLMSLRSAMNPHFIFNALNSIQFFISKNERAQAIQYLATFSKLIRGILTGSAQNRIRLSEEIDLLKHYLDLEQIRFENKFTVQFDMDPAIDQDSIEVPSLLIQPFVENAILHGLSNLESGGILKLSLTQPDGDHILFEVEDNGIGRVAAKKLRDIHHKQHRSMGISLAEERLKLINGASQLSIVTDDLYSGDTPCGTRVRIWFDTR